MVFYVINKNDNARKLRESSCIIENLYPYSGRPYVTISGPTSVCDGGFYTWYANVQGGSAPYSYDWEISTDGINYFSFGSGQYVSARYPFVNYQTLKGISDFQEKSAFILAPSEESISHLRVKVTDSKQESAYGFITISPNNSLPPIEFAANQENTMPLSDEKPFNNNDEINFSIYPNPAQVYTNLQYRIENPCKVQISLLNSVGQTLYSYKIDHVTSGVFIKELTIDHLSNGIYFINVILGDRVQTQKLIISR